MNKLLYLLSAATVSLTLASCSLDADDITEATTDKFPTTEEDATASLAGVYENLNQVAATPQESFLHVSMLASDDNLGGGGTNDKLMQAEDLLCNYNQNMLEQFYKDRYQGISRANILIEALPKITSLSEEVRNTDLGEALFLRAFYHYELASMYGNVPLMTEATGKVVKQGDVKTLWGQILQDFYQATQLLPAKRRYDGHVDKYTAEGMLARAFLFYTGMYCNGTELKDLVSTTYKPLTEVDLPDGTKLTKKMVSDLVDDCVNKSGCSLVSDYRNLWAYTNRCTVEDYDYTKGKGLKWVENDQTKANDSNPESMFAIKFNKLASWSTTIGYANGYALHFGMRGGQDYANTFPFGQGWGAAPWLPTSSKSGKLTSPTICVWKLLSRMSTSCRLTREAVGLTSFRRPTITRRRFLPISAKNGNKYVCCFEDLMYGDKGLGLSGGYGNNMQLDNIHDLVLCACRRAAHAERVGRECPWYQQGACPRLFDSYRFYSLKALSERTSS